ncbi:MAG: PadR family transcriptional regulator [Propionibacteriaceae bacterium]|jgi:PadR family transcriptional regulator PadR|nr:PadR family transcriptional regulator [Propionibacteriaceae bacterium]
MCHDIGVESVERPAEWLRGLLDLCVLAVIEQGPTYGYKISTALTTAGLGEIKGGTLYPLLSRAERDGLVDTHWEAGDGGPGRKFYTLTSQGQQRLAELRTAWENFREDVNRVVEGHPRIEIEEES